MPKYGNLAPKLKNPVVLPLFYTKNWHADLEFACNFAVFYFIFAFPFSLPFRLCLNNTFWILTKVMNLASRAVYAHGLHAIARPPPSCLPIANFMHYVRDIGIANGHCAVKHSAWNQRGTSLNPTCDILSFTLCPALAPLAFGVEKKSTTKYWFRMSTGCKLISRRKCIVQGYHGMCKHYCIHVLQILSRNIRSSTPSSLMFQSYRMRKQRVLDCCKSLRHHNSFCSPNMDVLDLSLLEAVSQKR